MLCNEEFSAFHALHNVVEIWYYHAGEPLNIYVISPDGVLTTHCLSADDEMQVVIEPEHWFAAELSSKKGFALVGCAVAPAFSLIILNWGKKKNCCKNFLNTKH